MGPCPVCGSPNGGCVGDTHNPEGEPIMFPPIGSPEGRIVANSEKVYLPKQHVNRGVAGYKNLKPGMIVGDKPAPKEPKPVIVVTPEAG